MIECTPLDESFSFKGIDLPRGSLSIGDEELLWEYAKGNCLDIGTFFGRSAMIMAQKAKMVSTIDTFAKRSDFPNFNLAYVIDELKRYEHADKIQVFCARSHSIAHEFSDEMFDLIFIDGAHDAVSVGLDFYCYYPKLKPGAYVLIHDCCRLYPAIVRFCEYLEQSGQCEVIERRGRTAVFRK